MRILPSTPEALLEELYTIFPEYRAKYDGPIHEFMPTYHSVLMGFTPFLGGERVSFSDRQLRALGDLASAAVAEGGMLGNAFDTCLLEHLHQVRAFKILRPYLQGHAPKGRHAKNGRSY